ncbi:MAG: glycosyltransferase, partial [bacterium]
MKRILVVTPTYPPEENSSAFVVGTMAKYFERAGWEVSVLTGREPLPEKPGGAPDDSRVHSFDAPSIRSYPAVLRPLLRWKFGTSPYRASALWKDNLSRALRELVKRESFEVILGINASTPAVIAAMAELPADAARAVWYIDPWYLGVQESVRDRVRGRFWAEAEARFLRNLDAVLLNSDDLADTFRAAMPDIAERCHPFYCGYDPDMIGDTSAPTDPGALCVAYYGRVRPEEVRALTLLIRAIAV